MCEHCNWLKVLLGKPCDGRPGCSSNHVKKGVHKWKTLLRNKQLCKDGRRMARQRIQELTIEAVTTRMEE